MRLHYLAAAIEKVYGVINSVEANDVAIEDACYYVFPYWQNPEEVTGREDGVKKESHLDVLLTPFLQLFP